jgi:hypothetical protein
LVINRDAVLALAVAFECLETVAGQTEILEAGRRVELHQLTQRHPLDRLKAQDRTAFKQHFGAPASERPCCHPFSILCGTYNAVRSQPELWNLTFWSNEKSLPDDAARKCLGVKKPLTSSAQNGRF